MPYNSRDYEKNGLHNQVTDIVVNSEGHCLWVVPMILKSTCKTDPTTFYQTCQIKFGSWTYNGWKINLTLKSNTADTSSYVINKYWELVGVIAKRNEIYYECCPEPYLDVTYKIEIKLRNAYHQGLSNGGQSLIISYVFASAILLFAFSLGHYP